MTTTEERRALTDGERRALLALAFRALFGRLQQSRDLKTMLATEITVETAHRRRRVATDGQVAEQFLFTHGHAGVLAALADQAGEVGMVQRRLGLGAGGGALLVNIGCCHKAPVLNSVVTVLASSGASPLPHLECIPYGRGLACDAGDSVYQMFCRSPFGSKNTEDTISASITLPSACGENTRSPMRFKPPLTTAIANE